MQKESKMHDNDPCKFLPGFSKDNLNKRRFSSWWRI